MVKGNLVLTIPNPHQREVGVALLFQIIKRAGITRKEWLKR